MNYYVYVLKSQKDKKLYYGFTTDLERRLKEHNKGKVQATKYRIPFTLEYFEEVEDIVLARKREKYFKSGFGRKYIQRKLKLMAPSSSG